MVADGLRSARVGFRATLVQVSQSVLVEVPDSRGEPFAMTPDRERPGLAFWTTVGVVVVFVGYPLSIGPAYWLRNQEWAPDETYHVVTLTYAPILWIYRQGPQPVHDFLRWYVFLWTGSAPGADAK